jgi:hypothetical protein
MLKVGWISLAAAALAYLTAALFLILGAGLIVDRYRHRFTIAIAAAFLVGPT